LLQLPQASSLFDPFAFTGFLQALKKGCTPGAGIAAGSKGAGGKGGKAGAGGKRKAAKQKAAGSDDDMVDEDEAEDDADEGDAEQAATQTQRATQRGGGTQSNGSAGNPQALCIECLQCVESFIRGFPLKDTAEMLALMLDTCVDIVSTAPNTPAASGGATKGRARARGTEGSGRLHACWLVKSRRSTSTWK
jgi:hypothetical protein